MSQVVPDPIKEDLSTAAGPSLDPKENREMEAARIQDLRANWDPQKLVTEFNRSFFKIGRYIRNRENLLRQTQYALLTAQHQFIVSGPGTAKSMTAEAVFSRFPGQTTFEIQLSRTTREDEFFGSPRLDKLKEGVIVRNLDGTIVKCTFAHIDEYADANTWAIRSLNGVLHERVYKKGQQIAKADIHTAIATANRFLTGEELEAASDRFLYQAMLPQDHRFVEQMAIDRTYDEYRGTVPPKNGETFEFQQLKYLSDITKGLVPDLKITLPSEIRFLKNALLREYDKERAKKKEGNFYPLTPRTAAMGIDHLNAAALLRGRSNVERMDLVDLRFLVAKVYSPEEEAFEAALKTVLQRKLSTEDVKTIKILDEAIHLVDEAFTHRLQGIKPERKLFEKFKKFIRVTTEAELTFGKISGRVKDLDSHHDLVKQYIRDCSSYIKEKMRLFSLDENTRLF